MLILVYILRGATKLPFYILYRQILLYKQTVDFVLNFCCKFNLMLFSKEESPETIIVTMDREVTLHENFLKIVGLNFELLKEK